MASIHRHNIPLEIETHVSGSIRVSIARSFCRLLSAERHGAEQNRSGARAAEAFAPAGCGAKRTIQVLMCTMVRDGDVMRLGRDYEPLRELRQLR